MRNSAFTFVTVILVALLGYGGYAAITGLTDPAAYVSKNTETIGDMHPVVTSADTGTETASASVPGTDPASSATTAGTASATTTASALSVSATLSKNLQALVASKTVLKAGSKGTSVGYVQQFVNLYFGKNLKVDNDFGATLTSNIKKFQSQNKLSVTGQVGKSTLQYMILWLKNNPQ